MLSVCHLPRLFPRCTNRVNRVSIGLFLSCIQMKSYLSGNPGLRIALNEDLVIGSDRRGSGGGSYGGSVVLDGELTTTITLRGTVNVYLSVLVFLPNRRHCYIANPTLLLFLSHVSFCSTHALNADCNFHGEFDIHLPFKCRVEPL